MNPLFSGMAYIMKCQMGLVDTHMMGLIGTVYQLTPRLQNRRIWPEQLASTEKMLSYSFLNWQT